MGKYHFRGLFTTSILFVFLTNGTAWSTLISDTESSEEAVSKNAVKTLSEENFSELVHSLQEQAKQQQQSDDLSAVVGKDHTKVTLAHITKAITRRKGPEIRIGETDAGGIRGIMPLLLWQQIEQNTGKKIHQLFDWLTGSSTGAIIAIALAARKTVLNVNNEGKTISSYDNVISLEELKKLYTEKGNEIFSGWTYRNPRGIFGPIYKPDGKMRLLTEILGDLTLLDVFCDLAVPFFDWKSKKNVWYTSVAVREGLLPNIYLRDLAQATSSPLLYFSAHAFSSIDGSVSYVGMDPGTYLPNTAAQVQKIASASDPSENNFLVVSMGTGSYIPDIKISDVMNTKLHTAAMLLLTMDMLGSSTAAHAALVYQFNRGGQHNYWRFDPFMGAIPAHLDDTAAQYIDSLTHLTHAYTQARQTDLGTLSKRLVTGLIEEGNFNLKFEMLQRAQETVIQNLDPNGNKLDGEKGYANDYIALQMAANRVEDANAYPLDRAALGMDGVLPSDVILEMREKEALIQVDAASQERTRPSTPVADQFTHRKSSGSSTHGKINITETPAVQRRHIALASPISSRRSVQPGAESFNAQTPANSPLAQRRNIFVSPASQRRKLFEATPTLPRYGVRSSAESRRRSNQQSTNERKPKFQDLMFPASPLKQNSANPQHPSLTPDDLALLAQLDLRAEASFHSSKLQSSAARTQLGTARDTAEDEFTELIRDVGLSRPTDKK